MRSLVLTIAVLLLALGSAAGGVSETARLTLGDVPRTHSHYLNAREAALCRADAATGGVAAYFLNPGTVTLVHGANGQASMRYNVKSREYLPDDAADRLDASDDGFLFSQAVAVKRSGSAFYGFGYSAPSYRSVDFTGLDGGDSYRAELSGGLRFFELLLGLSLGGREQGGIGIAAGLVDLEEQAHVSRADTLDSAQIDGLAASFAAGFVYEATDGLILGAGHRWGASVDVDGEWNFDGRPGQRSGESKTQSTSVVGVQYRPAEPFVLHASYIQEGWHDAESSLAAYEDTERDLFGDAIGTAALGAEVALPGGRYVLRAGASQVVQGDADDAIVPEYSVGVGVVVHFREYSAEVSLVREQFELNGKSGEVVNYGVYASVGYAF
jgi:hypothetical protein